MFKVDFLINKTISICLWMLIFRQKRLDQGVAGLAATLIGWLRLKGSTPRKSWKLHFFCRLKFIRYGANIFKNIMSLAQKETSKTEVEEGRRVMIKNLAFVLLLIKKSYSMASKFCWPVENGAYSVIASFEVIKKNDCWTFFIILVIAYLFFSSCYKMLFSNNR